MESNGIKETLELLQGIKDIAVDAKKVLKDGAVNLADLPIAMELLGQLGELSAAVQGVDQVVAEVKDLDAGEINQIVAKVLEIAAAVKAA